VCIYIYIYIDPLPRRPNQNPPHLSCLVSNRVCVCLALRLKNPYTCDHCIGSIEYIHKLRLPGIAFLHVKAHIMTRRVIVALKQEIKAMKKEMKAGQTITITKVVARLIITLHTL
jgi:hypothetical protein